jgi:hypothetical protein
MAVTLNANTSTGFIATSDTSGVLQLQTGGTTAVTVDASQNVTMAGKTTNPTTISVGNATPSASGAGITFPAAISASSDANTLDDYEEGDWTPIITAGSGSITSYTSAGTYVKIGRQVTLTGYFIVTNNGTGSSYGLISGFPFTSGNATKYNTCGIGRNGGTNGYTNNLNMSPNSSDCQCWTYANAYPWATNASLQFSITYFTA